MQLERSGMVVMWCYKSDRDGEAETVGHDIDRFKEYLVRGGCESMRCILLHNLRDGGVISDRKNDDNVERMSS
jgi:hypothetical protein